MAKILENTPYSINTTDGTDLYLTSTTSGENVSLLPLDSDNLQQVWTWDGSWFQIFTISPVMLYLDGSETPCLSVSSQPTTRNYYDIEGNDDEGYTIQWLSIDPVPNGQSLGYLVPDGNNVKISANKQKWKFTKVVGGKHWVVPKKNEHGK